MRSGLELYVALMLALFEFFRREFLRRLSCGDRRAAHEIVETWGGEYECQADIFIAGISHADPGVGRNKDNGSRMDIALLCAQPYVGGAGLNQPDLVLTRMFVSGISPPGGISSVPSHIFCEPPFLRS